MKRIHQGRRQLSLLATGIVPQVASSSSIVHAQASDVKAILDLITNTADRICYKIADTGSASSAEARGAVNAELSGLASRLLGAGVTGTGSITNDQYQNVLRQELATSIRESAKCKLQVFESLKAMLLTVPVPSRSGDALRQQGHSNPTIASSAPSSQSAPPKEKRLTPEDIAIKIDVWRSISRQMRDLDQILNKGYALLDEPIAQINLSEQAKGAENIAVELHNKRLVETLKEARRAPGAALVPGTIFDRVPRSIEGFTSQSRSLYSLGNQTMQNRDTIIPYVAAFRRDLNALRDWQLATRRTAESKEIELSHMGASR
jgi:hypothetical protein